MKVNLPNHLLLLLNGPCKERVEDVTTFIVRVLVDLSKMRSKIWIQKRIALERDLILLAGKCLCMIRGPLGHRRCMWRNNISLAGDTYLTFGDRARSCSRCDLRRHDAVNAMQCLIVRTSRTNALIN